MKIGFLYGAFSLGQRPIDFANLYTAPRGLTGSELSCIEYAKEMSRRGHDVELFIPGGDGKFGDVTLRPIRNLASIDRSYDAAISWNEPDLMRQVKAKKRVVNQQLNDFTYCHAGFDDFVDMYTSPSKTHCAFICEQTPIASKWHVLPNGCNLYPDDFTDPRGSEVSGRVIYASSPDRGLHNLLEMWPRIKKAVPHAHLRIFYEMGPWLEHFLNGPEVFELGGQVEAGLTETGYRARYVALALERLRELDVMAVGSVSRDQMAREMAEAQCLAYPCDPIRFTEGFSVTTLEACASGAVPVISSVDALGELYGALPTVIPHPLRYKGDPVRLGQFGDAVIRVLTDPEFRDDAIQTGWSIASEYSWGKLGARLEELLR